MNVEEMHKEYCSRLSVFHISKDIKKWVKFYFSEKFRKNYKNKNWNEIELKLLGFMIIAYSCIEKKPIQYFVILFFS